MTYPPPDGNDPQQYHVSSQPPQPSDPYSQGYSAPPPPPGYGQSPGQYPPPPNMTPPVGVQPGGYPPGSPSPLPPPIPPANQGSNLGVILGVIVALVVVLGVAAVLIVPGMLEDDGGTVEASDESSASEAAEEESPSPEEQESPAAEESEGTTGGDETDGGGFEGWGAPVNSNDYDPNTPEGVGISWELALDDGDMDALAALMCSSPSEDLQWDYDYEVENNTAPNYDFLIWAMAKEPQNGEIEVWAGWTLYDNAPASQEDIDSGGGQYYTVVEEDGTWKVCDIRYF